MTEETITLAARLDQARFDAHAAGEHARGTQLGIAYDRFIRGQITPEYASLVLDGGPCHLAANCLCMTCLAAESLTWTSVTA